MVIQHNMGAINTSRHFKMVNKNVKKSTEKLSSGYKVNRAADDAAGLSISEKMRNMIRNLNMASNNAEDGISLLQTADGALNEMHSILHRMSELSVQAANDVNSEEDRQAAQDEIDNLITELDRIADSTEFNNLKLLDGSFDSASSSSPFSKLDSMINFATVTGGIENVNGVIINNPLIDSTAVTDIGQTKAEKLQSVLVDSIVPQAVNSLLNAFPVFNSAVSSSQVSNGIGLKLYCDGSSTLAYVACQYGYSSDGTIASNMIALNLSVNTNTLKFDTDGNLLADSRVALENTIVHEMMHAFMDDTLTNGMLGATNGVIDSSNAFLSWFKEGMAQSAVGGCANTNDWVNGGLGLTENSTDAEISSALKSSANSLSSGSTASEYGTGYLACMYLGYMAAGEPSTFTSSDLANGLNTVLGKLISGSSMDDVIKEISSGKYTDTADFESSFGDSDSTSFVSALLKAVGSTGNGGVVGALTASDLLVDSHTTSTAYSADIKNEFVTSSVGSNRNWATGGRGASGSSSGSGSTGGGTGGGTGGTGGVGQDGFYLQVGALAGQDMKITLQDMHASVLGVDGLSVMSHSSASDAMKACYNAVKKVSATRSEIGAYVNRLEYTINNLENSAENTQAAESRIRDTDMANEMTKYSLQSILAQAAQAMISQANQRPESVLTLLQI